MTATGGTTTARGSMATGGRTTVMGGIMATARISRATGTMTALVLGFILCRWYRTVDGWTVDRLHLEVPFCWRYREWIYELLGVRAYP